MATTKNPTEIYFQTDKNGKPLAYRYCRLAGRPIRIAIDKAYLMIATGEGSLIDGPL